MASDKRRALLLEVAAVAGIILVAAVLRMGWPGLTEFKADEARLYVLALEMSQGQLALRGISSSVGFPNFPMSVWLYSLPLFVWPHPYSATLFTGLLNTVSLLGAYWLVRRYWGRTAALAALLMLAVSPWAIIYSRKIWAQNLLPLFTMIWGMSAALAFVESRRAWLVVHLVSLAVAVQIHLAAVALVPATLLFLVVFRRRVSWVALGVGVSVALLTAAPFFVYLAQSGTGLPALGGAEEAGAAASVGLSARALTFASMVSVGSDIQSLAGPLEFQAYLDRLPPMLPVYLLWGGLILGGLAWLIWQIACHWSDQRSQVGLILAAWLLAPLLVFTVTWTQSFPHYFISTLPAQYMIAGVAFAAVVGAVGRWGRVAGWSLLLASVMVQLFAWATLLSVLATRPTPGAFGIPLSMKLAAADAARADVMGGAAEVIIAGEGSSPRVDSFPAEYDALLHDVPRRFVDLRAEALFPASPAVVLADGRLAGQQSMIALYQTAAASEQAYPFRTGEGNLLLLALPGESAPAPATEIPPPNLLANWVRLTGADWLVGQGVTDGVWQLHWTPGENPDPATYHFFAHALSNRDQRIAQDDQPAFSGEQWRPGDRVISRFVFDWSGKDGPPVEVSTGMYRFPELDGVSLLDEAANPAGEAIAVPLDDEQ